MKGDFSRQTADPKKHYSGVLMQQGRVQLDADWNEQLAISQHRVQTEARTTEGEVNAAILVQPVGFVEQLRNFLHLVDNYLAYGLVSFELGSKQLGAVKIAAKFLGFEQVYPKRVRIGRGQQRGFARLPRTPQKKRLRAGLRELQ